MVSFTMQFMIFLGFICIKDIQKAFQRLDIHLDLAQAKHLVKKVDQAGNEMINYYEWREFLIIHPADDLSKIFDHWHFNTVFFIYT